MNKPKKPFQKKLVQEITPLKFKITPLKNSGVMLNFIGVIDPHLIVIQRYIHLILLPPSQNSILERK